jgi:tetratricopeptide (TPR) repeat protein
MASSIASSAAALLVAALSLAALPALADQPTDPKLAQSLFDRARALMDQARFAEACPLLEESQRLDPGGGTLLNLAVCLEGAGKLATAHATFHEALSQAIRDGRDDRKKIAEERVAALGPRLSTLTVEVPAEARVPDLVVWLDGAKLSPIAWGVPTAVDGGDHRVEAAAPEAERWVRVVAVSPEGDRVTVRVEAPRPLFAPDADTEPGEPATKPVPKPAKPKPRRISRLSTASWATGGTGLGLFALGAAMGIAAVVEDDKLETEALENGCNLARGYCPDEVLADDYASRAETVQALGWAATGALGAGAVLLIVAPLLPRERVVPTAAVTPAGASFGLAGSF